MGYVFGGGAICGGSGVTTYYGGPAFGAFKAGGALEVNTTWVHHISGWLAGVENAIYRSVFSVACDSVDAVVALAGRTRDGFSELGCG